MEKYLIISANPKADSFTHSAVQEIIATLTKQGKEVHHEDLYEKKFQPVLGLDDFAGWHTRELTPDVIEQQNLLKAAHKIIFVYPIWWYDAPAILKGWFDRVFTYGFAYHVTAEGPKGLFNGKTALVVQTVGGSSEIYHQYGHIRILQDSIALGRLGWSGIPTEVETLFDVGGVGKDRQYHDGLLKQVRARVEKFTNSSS